MPVQVNYDSTYKKLELIQLADEFEDWVSNNRQLNQSDMELLFAWLDSDEYSIEVDSYKSFLAVAQKMRTLGYQTAIDVPISEEDYLNRKVVHHFECWLKKVNQPLMSGADYLLAWIDDGDGSQYVTSYQHFLRLTQTLVNKGYKASVDVPISEEDYLNRKVIHHFEHWLKKTNPPLMRAADYLLAWVEEGNGSRHIKNYQHFLRLTQTLVNKGYKASIDVPISEAKFKQIYNVDRPTIFFKIVKNLLIDDITEYKKRRSSSDTSTTSDASTVLLSFFFGCAPGSSKTKMKLAEKLLLELYQMTSEQSDWINCDLLTSFVEQAKKASGGKGSFERRMDGALSSLDAIYKKLAKTQLLDIVYNNNPFNQFCYYMALYFAKKAVEALNQKHVIHNFNDSKNQIAAQDEVLILQTLESCARDLENHDHEHHDKVVVRNIEQLREEIIKFDEHKSQTLPSSLLMHYLSEAQKKICPATDDLEIDRVMGGLSL